jgi:hypothetical protein
VVNFGALCAEINDFMSTLKNAYPVSLRLQEINNGLLGFQTEYNKLVSGM